MPSTRYTCQLFQVYSVLQVQIHCTQGKATKGEKISGNQPVMCAKFDHAIKKWLTRCHVFLRLHITTCRLRY
uniref:Uncharacterized protein n=1 Tax=Arundo donax TaxID=35708 RepID=A0A0A9C765_ARUDO